MNSALVRISLALALAVVFATGAVSTGLACVDAPPQPPPTWVQFLAADPTQVWITFHNYTTFGAEGGQYCVCALMATDPIISIDAVTFFDEATGLPIPGFVGFDPNETTSNDPNIGEFGDGWAGFLSAVAGVIPTGLTVDIRFEVTVPPGTTFEDIADGLGGGELSRKQGTYLATDEGNSDGSFTFHHFQILPPGIVDQGPVDNFKGSWGAVKSSFR